MVEKKIEKLKIVFYALVALALWGIYFAVCSAPLGAPFIYAEF
jgi:hypothetical protein